LVFGYTNKMLRDESLAMSLAQPALCVQPPPPHTHTHTHTPATRSCTASAAYPWRLRTRDNHPEPVAFERCNHAINLSDLVMAVRALSGYMQGHGLR